MVAHAIFSSVCRLRPHRILVPEEQGDAPQSSQTHQCVDDPADHTGGAAAEKGHQVELEEPDQPPVDPADDGQDQRDFINDFQNATSLK